MTVEIVDQRGGASISLHPTMSSFIIENTVIEEVPKSPLTKPDRNRIEIFVTPSWVGGIRSGRGSQFEVERFAFRETKSRAIAHFLEDTHNVCLNWLCLEPKMNGGAVKYIFLSWVHV
jgi:hypothetical protein